VRMRIRQAGATTAPVVVLLHGSGRASRMWDQTLAGLSAEWHVLAPDLPGFGRSEGPFTVAGAAQLVYGMIAVQTAPVHLCGLSLGGVVAVRAAAQLGSQVASLVVTGTPVVPGRDLPASLRRFRRLPAPLLPLFSDVTGRAEWLRMLDELEHTDLRGYLPQVTAPALVVCGSRDWRAMPAACELAAGLPGGRLWIAPHRGHSWPSTSPELFGKVVTGFIGATAGPPGELAAARA
ncbi:MAG: alpha/beta fold hydrolase, partial [Actinobacteria bacterium]|nr:alpha/beta fold hydrolase [Actinomycetota bacterium]